MDQPVLAGYYCLSEQSSHYEAPYRCSISLSTEGEIARGVYLLQHFFGRMEEERMSPVSREEEHAGDIDIYEHSTVRIVERVNGKVTRQGVYILLEGRLCALFEQGIALCDFAHNPILTLDEQSLLATEPVAEV